MGSVSHFQRIKNIFPLGCIWENKPKFIKYCLNISSVIEKGYWEMGVRVAKFPLSQL